MRANAFYAEVKSGLRTMKDLKPFLPLHLFQNVQDVLMRKLPKKGLI